MDEIEMEARQLFERDLAPGPQDEALDRAAVEWALSRVRQKPTFRAWLRGLLFRPAAGWGLLGSAALAAVVVIALHGRQPSTTAAPPGGVVAASRPLILQDGSEIASEAATMMQVAEQTATRTTVRLQAGAARFRVRHDARRLFRVDAGPIQIEDLGTIFHVAHQPAGRVRVTVTEGRVAVVWPATRARVELGAGADRVFSATAEPPEHNAPTTEGPPAPQAAAPPVAPSGAPHHSSPAESPARLLLSADEARRSGDPRAAVNPLRRLVDRYPTDPRAPSAAFTLGWILLTDLDRPRDAALAFAEAERIAPRGTLAEDAAARVAEAWQKAGDAPRARAAARHYQQAYPTGRYLRVMGGIAGPQPR